MLLHCSAGGGRSHCVGKRVHGRIRSIPFVRARRKYSWLPVRFSKNPATGSERTEYFVIPFEGATERELPARWTQKLASIVIHSAQHTFHIRDLEACTLTLEQVGQGHILIEADAYVFGKIHVRPQQ